MFRPTHPVLPIVHFDGKAGQHSQAIKILMKASAEISPVV